MTYTISDPLLGDVTVRTRRSSSRFSARWHEGKVTVIAPAGASHAETVKAIDSMRMRLLKHRPAPLFTPGMPLILDGGITYHFESTPLHPGRIRLHPTANGGVIAIGTDIPTGTPDTDAAISRLLISSATRLAEIHILPRALRLADEHGLEVAGWRITRGRHTLGTCSSRRIISLSSLLIFLPQNLRDYIICHELAHLTEMNHSPRFHALCDSYCHGAESELKTLLRNYRWPILR